MALAGIVLATLLDRAWPAHMVTGAWRYPVGALLVLGGWALSVAAKRRFHQAGTPVRGSLPTTALVTAGVYAHTRNPLYLALLLIMTGVAVGWDNPWLAGVTGVFWLYLQVRVVADEERRMAAQFGADYAAYRARTRRWF